MIQESSANDLVQEKLGMDFDGMQIEDGGEPSVSDWMGLPPTCLILVYNEYFSLELSGGP